MSLVKYNSHRPAKHFGNFFDEFFNRNLTDVFGTDISVNSPSINVLETEHAFKIDVAAPGLDKTNFDVKAEGKYLNISAKKEDNTETKAGKYFRREFNYGSFTRSFQIPETVDASKIDANYENGILSVSLPKKEEVIEQATSRVIEIK